MEDNWGRWTPDIKDGSMSGGSDFEVIEEKEEEESQQQPNAEVGENGQQRSMVAAEDVNVPTGNGVELGWHMDNLNLANMKRTLQLEKQLLEERMLTSEMKVAKLEAEKSELNTKLEMMELRASKSGEENELLKKKLEQFGTSIGKLEELKLNARLGEEFQAFSLVQFPIFRLLIAGDNDHGSGSAAWKFGNDYLTVTKRSPLAWASVIAERPFPVAAAAAHSRGRRLLFYFEVTVLQLINYVCIGLCGPGFPLMGALVGDCAGSFAISSNGGSYGADGHWQRNGLPGGFGTGDVVGFGMLLLPFEGSLLFFTKNGQLLGKQFTFTSGQMKGNFYPTVSAFHAGTAVKVNLGDNLAAKPFRYNLCHLKQMQMKGDWYPTVSAYHAGASVKVDLGDNLAAKPFRYNLCHLKQIRI